MRVELMALKHASEMSELNKKLEQATADVEAAQREVDNVRRSTSARIQSASNTLRAELTERQVALLDSIVGGYEAQVRTQAVAIVQFAVKDSLMTLKVDSLEHINARLLSTLESANELNKDLAKQIKPSPLKGIATGVALLLALIL